MVLSDSEYDWIILNVNVTGYYRIKYDEIYWKRLATVLENDPKVILCSYCFSVRFLMDNLGLFPM